ncbi:unnamed protein product [Amoebophrya sp. A120]|nr:unnamed protein product [Amoebophrya sp. A120]|eukprot:GSA120T00020562001.1
MGVSRLFHNLLAAFGDADLLSFIVLLIIVLVAASVLGSLLGQALGPCCLSSCAKYCRCNARASRDASSSEENAALRDSDRRPNALQLLNGATSNLEDNASSRVLAAAAPPPGKQRLTDIQQEHENSSGSGETSTPEDPYAVLLDLQKQLSDVSASFAKVDHENRTKAQREKTMLDQAEKQRAADRATIEALQKDLDSLKHDLKQKDDALKKAEQEKTYLAGQQTNAHALNLEEQRKKDREKLRRANEKILEVTAERDTLGAFWNDKEKNWEKAANSYEDELEEKNKEIESLRRNAATAAPEARRDGNPEGDGQARARTSLDGPGTQEQPSASTTANNGSTQDEPAEAGANNVPAVSTITNGTAASAAGGNTDAELVALTTLSAQFQTLENLLKDLEVCSNDEKEKDCRQKLDSLMNFCAKKLEDLESHDKVAEDLAREQEYQEAIKGLKRLIQRAERIFWLLLYFRDVTSSAASPMIKQQTRTST